jgi:hypothetical protein
MNLAPGNHLCEKSTGEKYKVACLNLHGHKMFPLAPHKPTLDESAEKFQGASDAALAYTVLFTGFSSRVFSLKSCGQQGNETEKSPNFSLERIFSAKTRTWHKLDKSLQLIQRNFVRQHR